MTIEHTPSLGDRAVETHETTVDGARLRYVTAGRGEPLVLLHGWPEDHRAWTHQIEPLSPCVE